MRASVDTGFCWLYDWICRCRVAQPDWYWHFNRITAAFISQFLNLTFGVIHLTNYPIIKLTIPILIYLDTQLGFIQECFKCRHAFYMCYAIQEPVKTKTVELFVRYALWWTHFAGCIHNDISLEQIDILNVRHKFIRCTFCAYISLCLNSDYSVLTNKRLVYMKCSSNSSLTVSNRIQRKKNHSNILYIF